MQSFSTSLVEMFTCLWRHRELVKVSVKREILGRYRGSFLGLLWSFFNPLFMLAVFTFVFSVVLQARWGDGSESKTEFAMLLFAGLLVFNLFAETISRAPTLVVSNVNYVKKVVFPLEILPFVILLAGLFHAFISVVVWLIFYMIVFGWPHPTVFLFPIALLPFSFFLMGLSWALASLGVYLRDVSQMISLLITALMFLSPIFYPVTSFPETYRFILYLNPLTTVVEQTRDLLFWGKMPDLLTLIIYWGLALSIAWMGFVFFQKTRKGFSDVL